MTAALQKNWFDVDRKGLAKLVERRGKASLVYELISNACDAEATTQVTVSLIPEDGVPKVWLTVTDDAPEGFADLRHAWTLYAESRRKGDASKRGRFNLGEKLVLALCDEASIITTTGGVMFDNRGRSNMRAKRATGSEFMGLARISRSELTEILADLKKVIAPPGIAITINDEVLPARTPIAVIDATLPTEVADAEGVLRRSSRKCVVHVFEPLAGEVPMLYEMGIPVVETGDKWHLDVQQKVPLNMDRDNVTPAYLRELRTVVVNALHARLTPADANATFVNEVLANEHASPAAVEKALELKYGAKRAIWDPSDTEANMKLVAQGYTLIRGAQLTSDQWINVRKHAAAQPAGRLAPTAKALFGPDGEDVWVPRARWTPGMQRVAAYSALIAHELLRIDIDVDILSDVTLDYGACYGGRKLVYNLGRLGHTFFNEGMENDRVNTLLIHELAHEIEANHLDEKFHKACCDLGARLTRLALTQPELFR